MISTARPAAGPSTAPADPSPDDVALACAVLRVEKGRRIGPAVLERLTASETWAEVVAAVKDVADEKRPGVSLHWANGGRGRKRGRILVALKAALPLVEATPDDPDAGDEPAEGSGPFRLAVLGAKDFADADYRATWLVRRILVEGQPCVVAAPKKGMKTSTMVDLAVSMATGSPFLECDDFTVAERIPTLFLSGESGGFVLRDTVKRVCVAKGIADWPSALEGNFFIGFELPNLNSTEQIAALADTIREHKIRVVMIDPLYLCLIGAGGGGSRIDPANLFDMGPLFQKVSRTCIDAGATPILIHHFKLTGVQAGEMPVLENMAYAGIQEFARQWILLGRREKFDPETGVHKLWMTVGGSAGHSGEWGVDVDEGIMRDDFTGRTWDVSIRPASEVLAESKGLATEVSASRIMKAQTAREAAKDKTLELNADKALEWLKRKDEATPTAWREGLNWNTQKFGPVVAYLSDRGLIEPTRIEKANKSGTRTVDGWKLAPPPGVLPLSGWAP